MQKNIESILVRLLNLALSAVVLFFVTIAIILASVRLWLGPELIKFVNEPQKLESFLSRFEAARTIDLTLTDANLSWEKWLIPELKISMLAISNKDDKLNIAILEDLNVSLGARSLLKNLLGEIAFDKVHLGLLQIYLESNWKKNLKRESQVRLKIKNPLNQKIAAYKRIFRYMLHSRRKLYKSTYVF